MISPIVFRYWTDLPRIRSTRTKGMTLPPEAFRSRSAQCRYTSRSLAPRFFNERLGLPGPGNGQSTRIEEPDLSEHAGLIPVDMLVGDFVALEFHHDHMRQRYF